MPQNPSELQQEASRLNGAQSKGPVTEEGKARSSQNNLKHGFNSRTVVLANESQEMYDALLAAYRAEYNPQGQTENDLVRSMTDSLWRLERIRNMEGASINSEMFINRKPFEAAFTETTAAMRQADALQCMGHEDNNFLEKIDRYEKRYERLFDRALKTLIYLQKLRQASAENSPAQVEPERKAKHKRNWAAPVFELQGTTHPVEAFHWQTTFTDPEVGQASACGGLQPDKDQS